VLGDAAFSGPDALHPRLRAYFSAIPAGTQGFGEGVFDTVGTSRRWLRPLIRLFVDSDVLFPVWERDVPFTVVNTPAVETGHPAVAGERIFRLPGGDRVMRDLIAAAPDGLVDILGFRRRFRAAFAAEIVDGALRLAATRVSLRIGRRWARLPSFLAPRVELVERFSDADDRQHVAVALSVPLLGRVYEYAGSFRYEVRAGAA
jgi:hypothetical protein